MPEEPRHPDRLLESVSNIDTARQTLGWALERIRVLESSNAQLMELLQQARADGAGKEAESARLSLDKRAQALAIKEKFVLEMQSTLNSLFKGEVDVREFLEQRRKLDELTAAAESRAQARMRELEERSRKESEQFERRAAEMEAAYQAALAQARQSHQNELQDFEKKRQEEALLQKQRDSRFREDLLEQAGQQAEQFHRKLMLLQAEHIVKRSEVLKEFEILRDKLLAQSKEAEERHDRALEMERARWDKEREELCRIGERREEQLKRQQEAAEAALAAERGKLAELVKLREEQLRDQQASLELLEKSFFDRDELRSREFGRRLSELDAERQAELGGMKEENRRLQAALESGASAHSEERLRLREEDLRKREAGLDVLQQAVQEREERRAWEFAEKLRAAEETAAARLEEEHARFLKLQESFDAKLSAELDARARSRAEELLRQKEALEAVERCALERGALGAKETREALEQERGKLRRLEEAHARLLSKAEALEADLGALREIKTSHAETAAGAAESAVVAPAARRRRLRPALAAAALAAALAAGAWLYRDSGRDYSLPSAHPSALAWDADSLWMSDWRDQAVYRLRLGRSGVEAAERFPLPDSHIMGMAVAGGRLYLADPWSRRIEVRLMDARLSLQTSVESPGSDPSSLAFDGRFLWSADERSKRVYRHLLDDKLTVVDSYPMDHAPGGLYAQAGELWSCDPRAHLLYRHAADATLRALDVYSLPAAGNGAAPTACIAWHDGRLWLAEEGSSRLMERPRWRLKRLR